MKKELKIFVKFFLSTFIVVLALNIGIPNSEHPNSLERVSYFLRSLVSGKDFYIGWIILLFPYLISRIVVFLIKKFREKKLLSFLYQAPIFLFVYACFYAIAFILLLSLLTMGFDSLWGYYEWNNIAYTLMTFYTNHFSLFILPVFVLLITIVFFKKVISFEKNLKRVLPPKIFFSYHPITQKKNHLQLPFFKFIYLLQPIALFTFLGILVKILFFIISDSDFLAYSAMPYAKGINVPRLDVHTKENRTILWPNLFLTIDSEGRIKINNIHCSRKEVETILKGIRHHLSTEKYWTSYQLDGRNFSFGKESKIILIADVDCEMRHIQPVLNMLASNNLTQVIFLTK